MQAKKRLSMFLASLMTFTLIAMAHGAAFAAPGDIVTFNGNGGTPASQNVTISPMFASATTVGAQMPPNPTWPGHIFTGWADGLNNPFTSSTPVNGNITVYAQWTTTLNVISALGTMITNIGNRSLLSGGVASALRGINGLAEALNDPLVQAKYEELETAAFSEFGSRFLSVTPGGSILSARVLGFVVESYALQQSSMELRFTAASPTSIDIDNTKYTAANAVVVDIALYYGFPTPSIPVTGPLHAPLVITVPIPAGVSAQNLVILHKLSSGRIEVITPVVSGNTCTFVVTELSPFAFVNSIGPGSAGGGSDTPAPPVPVVYDIAKSGGSFTFKTIIANAPKSMAGATVTVKLNDKYLTIVTIGENGVGNGTLEAPGFGSGAAVFSARINAMAGVSVSTPMFVTSSGKVIRR